MQPRNSNQKFYLAGGLARVENTRTWRGEREEVGTESNPWLVDAAWQLIQNHTSDTMVNYGVTYPTLDATMEPTPVHTYTYAVYQDLNEPAQIHGMHSLPLPQ